MKLPRKKNKKNQQEGRGGVYTRRSLPVDRYYSPSKRRDLSGVSNKDQGRFSQNTSRSKRPDGSSAQIMSKLVHWLGYSGIVAVFVLNGWLGSVGLKVRTSDGNDIEYRTSDDYQAIVTEAFNDSLWNRTKVSFNSQRFEEEVMSRLPEVQSATAIMPLVGTKLQVGLELSHPLARLTLDQQSQGIVGDEGVFVFQDSLAAVLSEYAQLPLLTIQPAFSASVGDAVLTDEEVALIQLLLNEFDGSEASTRHAVSAINFDIEKREMDVRFRGVPYFAKLTSERDTRAQVGSLVASLEDLVERGSVPSQYIDVRVEGRVFIL